MGHSNIMLHCIVLQVLHFVLDEVAIESVTQTLRYIALFFKCYILFLMRLPLNGLLKNINKQYGVISCLIDLIFPNALIIIMFFSSF